MFVTFIQDNNVNGHFHPAALQSHQSAERASSSFASCGLSVSRWRV